MVNRIKELCGIYGINFSRLERELGFANGSLAKSRENIQADRLYAIASYFHVTMEYLLTGNTTGELPEPSIADRMKKDYTFWNYAEIFFFLPQYAREKVYDYLEMVSDKVEKEKSRVSAS